MSKRGLPRSILMGTTFATTMSGSVLIAMPELVFREGIAFWIGYGSFMWIFTFGMVYVGRMLQVKLPPNVRTLPDLVVHYYGEPAGFLSVLLNYAYNLARTGTQVLAIGTAFNTLFKIPLSTGLWIASLLLLAFVMLSGLWSVVINDYIQGVLMLIAVPLGVLYLWRSMGGFAPAVSSLPASYFSPMGKQVFTYWLAMQLGAGMKAWGQPEMYQRLMIGKSSKTTIMSWAASALIQAMFFGMVGVVGFYARLHFPALPSSQAVMKSWLSLPLVLRSLWVGGFLAATLSTADSSLILAATNVANDVYRRYINPKAQDSVLVTLTRLALPVSLGLTMLFAFSLKSVFDLHVWGLWLLLAGSLVLVPGTLLWPGKLNKWAGFPTMLFGLAAFLCGGPFFKMSTNNAYLLSLAVSAVIFLLFNLGGLSQRQSAGVAPGWSNLDVNPKTLTQLFLGVCGVSALYVFGGLFRWDWAFYALPVGGLAAAVYLVWLRMVEHKEEVSHRGGNPL